MNYLKKTILTIAPLILFQACAIDQAIADNYKANKKYEREHGINIANNRAAAKRKFKNEKTQELISAYGSKRGYLIAQKALTDENIQYTYDSKDYRAFIDNKVLVKYINETRGLEDNNNKETIIIIKK